MTNLNTAAKRKDDGRRMIRGDRPPSFVSKATLASELDISESTVDILVQRGILPKPLKIGGSTRWKWADIEASLAAAYVSGEADPFMKGVANVT